jgi:hypothetical protein
MATQKKPPSPKLLAHLKKLNEKRRAKPAPPRTMTVEEVERKQAAQARSPEEVREQALKAIRARWKDKTQVTPAALELARMASEQGATVASICDVLEIGREKFYRWMDSVPAFAAAIKEGRSIEHDRLVNKLVEVALKGNVAALCFALKSRHNYVDTGAGAATIENKVSVNFILPDAMRPDDYLKTLTASAEIIAPRDAARALAKPGVKRAVLRELTTEANNVEE